MSNLPAILGGDPAFPGGTPAWPLEPWPEVKGAIQQAMQDGSWGQYHGPHCQALTEELAEFHLTENVHLCSSGTAAVELALRGLKVSPGDEVILAAYDFKANFQNVLSLGAIPVLVDLDETSWQMGVEQIESAISQKTKAIIASHLHGGLVEIVKVCEIATQHGIPVIEDACQATGASILVDEQLLRAGTIGDVGVLSFGGSKLLTSGRGGAVLTNRAEIAQRIRLYTQRGNDAYPLSELQAAVLGPQLRQLDDMNETRLERAHQLADGLHSAGHSLFPLADLSRGSSNRPAFYKLGMRYKEESLARDKFCAAAREDGIALDPGFRSLHLTHSRRRFRAAGNLTQAVLADEKCVMLHHPVLLEDNVVIDQVVNAIGRILANADEVARTPSAEC